MRSHPGRSFRLLLCLELLIVSRVAVARDEAAESPPILCRAALGEIEDPVVVERGSAHAIRDYLDRHFHLPHVNTPRAFEAALIRLWRLHVPERGEADLRARLAPIPLTAHALFRIGREGSAGDLERRRSVVAWRLFLEDLARARAARSSTPPVPSCTPTGSAPGRSRSTLRPSSFFFVGNFRS